MNKGEVWQRLLFYAYKTSHSSGLGEIVGKKAMFIPMSYLARKMFILPDDFEFGFKIRVKRFRRARANI